MTPRKDTSEIRWSSRAETDKAIYEAVVGHPWVIENIAANFPWTVPTGKIYEVYALLIGVAELYDIRSNGIVAQGGIINVSLWYPNTGAFNLAFYTENMLPHGWTMSEGEGLTCSIAWVVRYREVGKIIQPVTPPKGASLGKP